MIRIALAGNPNSGKTTMFNHLTGSTQYVGNWPGVTVEKKGGKLLGNKEVEIIDLPGIYSLSPYTLEEVIARNYLMEDKPDVLINIVDSTNIERNLYLTTQLMETGIPMVIALNMIDLLEKKGDTINLQELSQQLGCPVVETDALKGRGSKEVVQEAIQLANKKQGKLNTVEFEPLVAEKLSEIDRLLGNKVEDYDRRWFAVKLLEKDKQALGKVEISYDILEQIASYRSEVEKHYDDDIESVIIHQRYEAIGKIVAKTFVKKHQHQDSISDKIDHVVTSRLLGLPIFAAVMFFVYYIAVTTIGSWGTDWVNEVLFEDIVPSAIGSLLDSLAVADWMRSLVLDGIIAGVGAVLGFLPQIMVLFLLLGILEDCGYMARVAFVMDRIFRKFGLSGKSFIPMLIGSGCSVPGIMASRTIENERDRKITIITTSFIPCSAKLPIIALLAGAIFPESTWVGPSAYFVGMMAVIITGIMLKKTKSFAGDPSPFVMELPPYHIPGAKCVILHMWDRCKSFVIKAGTVIFLASAIIWFMSNFNLKMEMVETKDSVLAALGNLIAPMFTPLGWGDWRAAVATITGLIAKENVVGTFGILYGFEEVAEDGAEVWGAVRNSFTQLSAYSFLVFNLICVPCFAAVGSIKREMGSGKWTLFAIGYQTLFAYALALIVYQMGMLYTGHGFTLWTLIAILCLLGILFQLFRPEPEEGNAKTPIFGKKPVRNTL